MPILANKRAAIQSAIVDGAMTLRAREPSAVNRGPGPQLQASPPTPLRIGSVALAVRDLGRLEAFYCKVIGLELLERAYGTARLGVGGAALLDLLHRPDALPDDSAAAGLYHVAFLLPSRAHLASWLVHAAGIEYPFDGASDHTASEAVYLRDPEGNGVEVYADKPRALWRQHQGELARGTRPLDIGKLLDEVGPPSLSWSGVPGGTRIGHVHLRVGDLGEAVGFCTGSLGLHVTRRIPGAVFLASGSYHHHIAANVWSSAGAGPRNPRTAGLVSLTLEASGEWVLEDIAGRNRGAGCSSEVWSLRDPWGGVMRIRL